MTLRERKERDGAAILAIIRFVLVTLMIVAAVFIGFKSFFFLTPILIGLVLAKAAVTAARGLERWLRRPAQQPSIAPNRLRRVMSIVFYILFFILIFLFLSIFVIFVIRTLTSLAKDIPQLIKGTTLTDNVMKAVRDVSHSLGNFLDEASMRSIEQSLLDLQRNLVQSLPSLLTGVLGAISGFFSSLPRLILIGVITVMSGYYFITQTDRIYRLLRRLIPDRQFVRKMFTLMSKLTSTLFRIIGGYLVLLIVTFVEAYIGLLILSVPNALTWALVTAIIDFLPILGVAFTLVPMAIVFLTSGQILTGIGLIVLFVVMTIVRRLIEPAILGNAMELHPVMTLMSMIVGIAIMGLSGIFLGPLIIVIAREIFVTFELEKRLRNTIGDVLRMTNVPRNASVSIDMEDLDENGLTTTVGIDRDGDGETDESVRTTVKFRRDKKDRSDKT